MDCERPAKDSLSILLYYYNWRMSYTPVVPHNPALGPVWSLAVEEQFYLLWPVLLSALLMRRVRRRWIVGLVLLGVFAPFVLRIVLWTGVESVRRLYMCTHTRLDGISAGGLVAIMTAWDLRPRSGCARLGLRATAWAAVAVLAGFVLNASSSSRFMYHGGFTVVSLCAAVLIAALVWSPPPLLAWTLQAAPLRRVGRISYGVYLWHIPVFLAVSNRLPLKDGPLRAVLIWVVSLAAGALSHYCVERPFLRLKERLDHGRERSVVEAPLLPKLAA